MDLETLRVFLAYNLSINLVFFVLWLVMIICARGFIYRMHHRLFAITEEDFTKIHYMGIAAYKMAIVLFLFVPYIVLRCCM